MSINEYAGELKVFTWEHEEWVIAKDPDDAGKAYEEHAGDTIQNQTGEDDATWEEEPADKVFKLDDGDDVTAKTCAEWAAERPRGYFASANY